MNRLYNKILNEVYLVQDFDSWDKGSEQIFRSNIKLNLSEKPREIIDLWNIYGDIKIRLGSSIYTADYFVNKSSVNSYIKQWSNWMEPGIWKPENGEPIDVGDPLKFIVGSIIFKYKKEDPEWFFNADLEEIRKVGEEILSEIKKTGLMSGIISYLKYDTCIRDDIGYAFSLSFSGETEQGAAVGIHQTTYSQDISMAITLVNQDNLDFIKIL